MPAYFISWRDNKEEQFNCLYLKWKNRYEMFHEIGLFVSWLFEINAGHADLNDAAGPSGPLSTLT